MLPQNASEPQTSRQCQSLPVSEGGEFSARRQDLEHLIEQGIL
jgi:hypothetical protein